MKIGDGVLAAAIGAIGGFVAAAIGYAIIFGEMKSDVSTLKTTTAKLEKKIEDFDPNEVKKGTLCLKLMESLTDEIGKSFTTRIDLITEQLERFDCYDGISAMSAPADSEIAERLKAK